MACCSGCGVSLVGRYKKCPSCKESAEKERCRIKASKQYYKRKEQKICVGCNKNQPDKFYNKCSSCRKSSEYSNVALRLRDKLAAFDKYGGRLCACCGETNLSFLQLDHIEGNGYKHRQEIGGGSNIFRWLKKNNYPSGFQVLCANCNWGKHINGGACPHKQRSDYITEEYYSYE